ncbi:hypothetical protein WH816_03985 [Klebsiella variicola]|uniref:hypothetical protein n=1 Tax=Klebsiella variicola TaxID=244366 RepID=UPI00339CE04D
MALQQEILNADVKKNSMTCFDAHNREHLDNHDAGFIRTLRDKKSPHQLRASGHSPETATWRDFKGIF